MNGITCTPYQAKLLVDLLRGNLFHLRGPQVRAALNLEKCGLLMVQDDGIVTLNGRADGERWSAKLTEEGKIWARSLVGVD